MMLMRGWARRRLALRVWWVGMALAVSGFVRVPEPSFESSLAPSLAWPRVGLASWYSERDPGIQPLTASGEPFSDSALTAAMWDVPFQSCLRVTNLKTLEQIAVRVNDRGPHKRFASAGRVIDLSKAAFAQFADLDQGLIPVAVELASRRRCISTVASRPD